MLYSLLGNKEATLPVQQRARHALFAFPWVGPCSTLLVYFQFKIAYIEFFDTVL